MAPLRDIESTLLLWGGRGEEGGLGVFTHGAHAGYSPTDGVGCIPPMMGTGPGLQQMAAPMEH